VLLSLLSLSVAAMVAADFTEEEVFTEEVEVFTEEAGSEAEDFTEGADFAAEVFTAEVDSVAEVGFEAELFVEPALFEVEPGFVGEPSAADSGEVFAAMGSASGAVSVSADAVGVGEAGVGEAGVGA